MRRQRFFRFTLRRPSIENDDQIARRVVERVRQSKDHRQAWHFDAAFEIADELRIGAAAIGELRLSQIARGAKFAQGSPKTTPSFATVKMRRPPVPKEEMIAAAMRTRPRRAPPATRSLHAMSALSRGGIQT
ncbi:MAG TPA: hypothetical protein VJZ76_22275 [Thermoanaerobaculia bacterium]|nr:hypothetical protein [Thermoanaerobaculia bacterium]